MDQAVALLVRAIVAFAGWGQVLPGGSAAHYHEGEKVKVLLAGYNGARNTGSDVRVAALADQIREALGPEQVELSVMSLDTASTAPYFEGKARQVPFNTIFFRPLYKACSEAHVVVLCEGSTFKSKFADALTLYSCEAAGVARAQGKPCIAYGGEIGQMAPFLERAVRDLCSDVLFISRSTGSYEASRALGLNTVAGTDTAWTFDSTSGHDEAMALLKVGGWDGKRPLLGIAPVNPHWWPVRPSMAKWIAKGLGSKRYRQFQKWYFFTWSEVRNELFQAYLDDVAAACTTFARERGFQPVIIGMEALDEEACAGLAQRMGGQVPVILSKNNDGYVIGETLRSLSLLVTSRYHAHVLASGADVPAVAVSMDERLDNLAEELDLPGELLLHVNDEDLGPRILLAMDYAVEHAGEIAERTAAGREQALQTLGGMADAFKGHVSGQLG